MGVAVPAQYQGFVTMAAKQYNVRPELLAALIQQESSWNPNAGSGAGAVGLAQFMPGTAASIGVNPRDPQSSIFGAAKLLSQYEHDYGSETQALIAYNWGPAHGKASLSSAPGETKSYVSAVLSNSGGQMAVTGDGSSSGSSGGAGTSISSVFSHLVDPAFWVRLGKGAAGIVVVLVGVWFLMGKDARGFVEKSIVANVI